MNVKMEFRNSGEMDSVVKYWWTEVTQTQNENVLRALSPMWDLVSNLYICVFIEERRGSEVLEMERSHEKEHQENHVGKVR